MSAASNEKKSSDGRWWELRETTFAEFSDHFIQSQ